MKDFIQQLSIKELQKLANVQRVRYALREQAGQMGRSYYQVMVIDGDEKPCLCTNTFGIERGYCIYNVRLGNVWLRRWFIDHEDVFLDAMLSILGKDGES